MEDLGLRAFCFEAELLDCCELWEGPKCQVTFIRERILHWNPGVLFFLVFLSHIYILITLDIGIIPALEEE